MNKNLVLITITIVVLVAIGLAVYFHPPQSDCAFSGWKKTLGVELEAQVHDVDAVKGKLGITDSQVREYDTLLKDYALKYDTACQDFRAKRIAQAEYTCRRQNMDHILDELRQFSEAVQAAKNVTDPTAQKEVVLKIFNDLRASSQAQYRSGCTSAVDINPKQLTFAGLVPERSIQITNRGNNDVTFSVDGLPEAFGPKPAGGPLARGITASVSIFRTLLPLPASQPITFHIRTNLEDDQTVEITADAVNAQLYNALGNQVLQLARSENREPTREDALKVVDRSLPTNSEHQEALRNYIAAGVLAQIGKDAEADKALDAAVTSDGSLQHEPSTLVLRGVLADRLGQPNQALKYFIDAKEFSPASDTRVKSTSDLFSAAIELRRGNRKSAMEHLSNPDISTQVANNPDLLKYTEKEFRSTRLGEAMSGPPN